MANRSADASSGRGSGGLGLKKIKSFSKFQKYSNKIWNLTYMAAISSPINRSGMFFIWLVTIMSIFWQGWNSYKILTCHLRHNIFKITNFLQFIIFIIFSSVVYRIHSSCKEVRHGALIQLQLVSLVLVGHEKVGVKWEAGLFWVCIENP